MTSTIEYGHYPVAEQEYERLEESALVVVRPHESRPVSHGAVQCYWRVVTSVLAPRGAVFVEADPFDARIEEVIATQSQMELFAPRRPSIREFAAFLAASVPREHWKKLPRDLSKNVDHYLYGRPKNEE